MRATGLTGVVIALLLLAGAAFAQEPLDASGVDTSEYPFLELVVTAPSGSVDNASDPLSYTILEAGLSTTPEVDALAATELDVVLAIDTSGSMSGGPLIAAKDAAAAFIAELPLRTRIAIIGIGPEPTIAAQLTSDREILAAAILGLGASGETALYDSLIAAAGELDTDSDARTALVVLSDGGDTVSESTLEAATASAGGSFDVVHAVLLVTNEQDPAALTAIASGGGSVVEVEDPVALAEIYADVATRVVNQYLLRWETTLDVDDFVTVSFDDGGSIFETTLKVDLDEAVVELQQADTDADAATAPDVAPQVDAAAPLLIPEPRAVPSPDTLRGWVLVVGIALLAAALFVSGLVALAPRERSRNLAEFRQHLPKGRELTGIGRRLVGAVERFLRSDPDRQVGLALRLERAGLDLSPAEFGAVLVAGCAVLGLLGFAVGGFIGLVLLPVLGFFGGLAIVDGKGQKRSRLFTEQLDGTLQLMAGSLRSGFGIMQALDTIATETEWPTAEEFTRVLGEVRLGRDLGAALGASALRIDSDDYYWVVQAIDISRTVGGNLAEVLDNVSQTIRQRNTLRRQVRALSAEGRLSAGILLALPFLMFGWMRFSNAEYIGLLYGRTGGRIALVAGLVLMATGALWMRKIVEVKF